MATTATEAAKYPTIVRDFSYSPIDPAVWQVDDRTGLEFRDLALDAATHGKLIARHWRNAGAERTVDLVDIHSPFAFLFVLGGTVAVEGLGETPIALARFGSATRYGRGATTRWAFAPGAELFQIAAADDADDVLGTAGITDAAWAISHDSEDSYVIGQGPRKFFKYRDLGTSEATGRRIHIHVVAVAGEAPGGTGWHWHTMGQIFYVLSGGAQLSLQRQPWVNVKSGDAMSICAGLGHNVPIFTSDYAVLEMCVPTDYDTIDLDG
jgi:quercetin dioxygenase-like cupin family protein